MKRRRKKLKSDLIGDFALFLLGAMVVLLAFYILHACLFGFEELDIENGVEYPIEQFVS